jgi:Arc/MetJ-type ribon-helix-helix transcriptional regulator
MNIDVTPETERIVREELSQGHFHSVDELIIEGVRAWHERSAKTALRNSGTGAEKAQAFIAWAKAHAETPPLSDEAISRASLNPDRW